MADGERLNLDEFSAASWFYPQGSKVQVALTSDSRPAHRAMVKFAGRGPTPSWIVISGSSTSVIDRSSGWLLLTWVW